MMNKEDNNSQYIEGNLRIRLAVFAFLGLWILMGLLLKPIAEKKIEQLKSISQSNPETSLKELSEIQIKYLILPMSFFLTIQGIYLSWLGWKTLRAGMHPPPSVRMPFKTKIQKGGKAKISALGYLFAGLCNFAIIVMYFIMRHEIFRHI